NVTDTETQETENLAKQEQFISLLEKGIQLENKLCGVILKRKQIEKKRLKSFLISLNL
ncbi:8774_t:CDS:1, partial [Entrophospora sp. SA101]